VFSQKTIRVVLSALVLLAILIVLLRLRAFILIPLLVLIPLLLSRKIDLRKHLFRKEEDPADWWKKGKQEEDNENR